MELDFNGTKISDADQNEDSFLALAGPVYENWDRLRAERIFREMLPPEFAAAPKEHRDFIWKALKEVLAELTPAEWQELKQEGERLLLADIEALNQSALTGAKE